MSNKFLVDPNKGKEGDLCIKDDPGSFSKIQENWQWRFIPRPDIKHGVVEIQNKATKMLCDLNHGVGDEDQATCFGKQQSAEDNRRWRIEWINDKMF